MGDWKKHQRKEIEALLCEFDAMGWRIEDPPTYYKVKCPCGLHKRTIHLTPSGASYIQNVHAWLMRQECTSKEGRK